MKLLLSMTTVLAMFTGGAAYAGGGIPTKRSSPSDTACAKLIVDADRLERLSGVQARRAGDAMRRKAPEAVIHAAEKQSGDYGEAATRLRRRHFVSCP